MGLARWYRRRHMRDPVPGAFRVLRAATLDIDNGHHRIRMSGVVEASEAAGVPSRPAVLTRVFDAEDDLPGGGSQFPATIDRARPEIFEVHWAPPAASMTALMARRAHDERAARAARLGLDPSALPRDEPEPEGFRDALGRAAQAAMGDPERLPDGRTPVSVAEAERLCREGEPATAVITAIDYLKLPARSLPVRGASLADVALDIRRADGTTYSTLARFGFRTPARRAQIGYAGAEVPVRIDPADPTRVTLDRDALPPLP